MRIARKVRNLAPYVYGEQPKTRKVIKLNTNEAAYLPSPRVMSVLKDFDPELLRRYPNATSSELRAELAKLNRTKPENIFVGNGSDEILSLMTDAFVEDDEAICSLDPSYSLYRTLADIRGVRWVGGSWEDARRKTGDFMDKVSLALITNPNNPTGTMIPPKEIAAFAKGFRGVVVVDEAYVEYASTSCMSLATAPRNRNVIVMRTFSKAYSLAGLRVGYCVGPKDLIAALYKIKDSYNVDAIAQTLALAALRDQKGLKAMIRKVIVTRKWFVAELEKRGWDVLPSEANFIFAKPPVAAGKREKGRGKRGRGLLIASELAEKVFTKLRERNIFIRYFKGPKTGDRVRISIGTDAQMKRVLGEIDDILV